MKKYDYVGRIIEGRNVAYVKTQQKYGLINEKGEEVLPPIYDELKPYYGAPFFHGILNGEHYSINKYGKILNSVPYSKISPFRIKKSGNIAMAKAKNGKYAYIGNEFQEISPFKYSFFHYAIHMILWKLGI